MKFILSPIFILAAASWLFAETHVAKDSITVEVVGKLQTGAVAIGGETTGVTITARGITWELQLSDALRKKAEQLSGKQAFVRGSLERREGVEVKERWIVTVTQLHAPEARSQQSKKLRAESRSQGTDVEVLENTHGSTVVDVRCESGIGRATLRRLTTQWPAPLSLRLHLRGLESLSVQAGDVTLGWSISSHGDNTSGNTLQTPAGTSSIDRNSDYFAVVQIVADNPAIPLKDGYFEVPLPAKLFAGNSETIELSWIDFFRQ